MQDYLLSHFMMCQIYLLTDSIVLVLIENTHFHLNPSLTFCILRGKSILMFKTLSNSESRAYLHEFINSE
jgi:hypothetical protein